MLRKLVRLALLQVPRISRISTTIPARCTSCARAACLLATDRCHDISRQRIPWMRGRASTSMRMILPTELELSRHNGGTGRGVLPATRFSPHQLTAALGKRSGPLQREGKFPVGYGENPTFLRDVFPPSAVPRRS